MDGRLCTRHKHCTMLIFSLKNVVREGKREERKKKKKKRHRAITV